MKATLYNATLKTTHNVTMLFILRNWKPALAIKLSILVFVGCIAFTLWQTRVWPWTLGIVCINHLILTIAGLLPRSKLLGLNIVRLPREAALRGEVAITVDDGPDPEVTPQVLDILDRHHAKATFFCIGKHALLHPELCREIVRRGHSVENHSLSHNWYFSLLDPWNTYREVLGGQTLLGKITGQTPSFFRATAGLRNPALDPVLAHLGLRLCSWSKRGFDTRVSNPDAVLNSLVRDLRGGDILLLHDGSAARTVEGKPVILEVLPRLLDRLAQANLHSVSLRAALP
jgi:peptidoglycan/xylan/chitin deacetylase (PgdA/CDA1 family)